MTVKKTSKVTKAPGHVLAAGWLAELVNKGYVYRAVQIPIQYHDRAVWVEGDKGEPVGVIAYSFSDWNRSAMVLKFQ